MVSSHHKRKTRRETANDESMLAKAAGQGDKKAYGALVRALERPLAGFIRQWVGPHEPEADDIAQRIWMEVWTKLRRSEAEGGFDPEKGGFYSWVLNYTAIYVLRRWFSERKRILDREMIESEFGISSEEEAGGRSMDDFPDTRPAPPAALAIEEEMRARLKAMDLLMTTTFLCGGYPHQQLAFGFNKLIYGKSSRRGIEGKPLRLDNDHGSKDLRLLAKAFLEDYVSLSLLPRRRIELCLAPITSRMDSRLKELFEKDQASAKQFPAPGALDKQVGGTRLKNYYSDRGPSYSIPDWCYKVEQRIRHLRGEPDKEKACIRCKLRHLPPCSGVTAKPPGHGAVAESDRPRTGSAREK